MSFLLAFFHLSPGQAPNWKTETQKPRQALESQSCPEKEAAAFRGKSQIPECERECKLTGSRLPHTLGSCSDLHTLKNSQGSSAHTVLSYRSVFFSFQDREKRRKKKKASSDSKIIAWQISNCTFHGSVAVRALRFAIYVIILEGAQDLNILKPINASRISHSLKGPLETRTVKWYNKSKAVDGRFRVPLGVWAALAGILPCQLGRRHK